MIGFLSGTVRAKRPSTLLLEVQGVGYKVHTPSPLLDKTETNSRLELHIHTVVREDELSLYGFQKEEELRLFEMFLTINGIGPKVAIELLSVPLGIVKTAILEKDVQRLKQIPGIGKKTAERIILELREKLGAMDSNHLPELEDPRLNPLDQDVLNALEGLGYNPKDIHRVFKSLKEPFIKSEEMIKYFLKNV